MRPNVLEFLRHSTPTCQKYLGSLWVYPPEQYIHLSSIPKYTHLSSIPTWAVYPPEQYIHLSSIPTWAVSISIFSCLLSSAPSPFSCRWACSNSPCTSSRALVRASSCTRTVLSSPSRSLFCLVSCVTLLWREATSTWRASKLLDSDGKNKIIDVNIESESAWYSEHLKKSFFSFSKTFKCLSFVLALIFALVLHFFLFFYTHNEVP